MTRQARGDVGRRLDTRGKVIDVDYGLDGGRGAPYFDRRTRAFVLWAGHTGLGIARSLGRRGIPVTLVDCDPAAPGLFSRYGRGLVAPDPSREPERLVDALIAAARASAARPVLLPATDAYVLFVSHYRDVLEKYFRFALPAPEVVEAVLNKRLQYALAERLGVSYPATASVSPSATGPRLSKRLRYPAFIKPVSSHVGAQVFRRKGFRVAGPEELAHRLAEIAPHGVDVLVQSIVPGQDSDVYQVLAWVNAAHEPLGVFTFRKLRQYPPEFGVGTLVESIHDQELARLGVTVLAGIQYYGLASVEFKRDARDGQLILIEVNARLPQQSSLPTRCGLNLPLLAYLDLTGQPALPTSYAAGVRWLDLTDDIRAAWAYARRGELGLKQWLAESVTARAFAYWDWRDPLPLTVAYASFCIRLVRKRWRSARWRSAAQPGLVLRRLCLGADR